MLMILALSSWIALGAYSIWFLFGAETVQPLTLNQLALTWRIHKQQMGCRASHIRDLITRNNEVVGFECSCGAAFLQKRLISQPVQVYMENHIKPSEASKLIPQETRDQLRTLNIPYMHVKEI